MGERISKKNAKEIGRLGGLQAAANRKAGVEKLMDFLRDGGSQRVEEVFERMLNDQELTKGELEFLKHYKDLMEYHTPKLSRTELTGKGGTELFPREQAKKLLNGLNES